MKKTRMSMSLEGKSVVIIGATGGLGSSIARALGAQGARILLAGRDADRLKAVAEQIGGDMETAVVDMMDAQSVAKLAEVAGKWSERIDIVVNAAGIDVRKTLASHSAVEIRSTLELNLGGAILLTQAFLPLMRHREGSIIVHIGGFADGRLAFPYYSVDAASRAGLYTFVEAVNRELQLERAATRVAFFCPSPADTEAERAYHPLWQKMSQPIASVEKVAAALLRAIENGKAVSIMGGWTTVCFAKLNSVWPKLADILVMNRYGMMMRDFFTGTPESQTPVRVSSRSSWSKKMAIALVVISCFLYGVILAAPFLPLTLTQKAILIPALVMGGEVTWWVGIALVGKEALTKYRKYFNPCNWFCGRRN